jgi:Bacterial SH3 domain
VAAATLAASATGAAGGDAAGGGGAAAPAQQEPAILGAPSGFAGEAEERQAVAAGTRLRERPDPEARVIAFVDEATELEVLERRGGWVRLRYGAWKGWAPVGGAAAAGGIAGLLPPAARPADPGRLARALAVLGSDAREVAFGPYRLHTDLADPALLARLLPLGATIEAAYRQRFGVEPGPAAGEEVVLFARADEYEAFSADEGRLAGLDSHGHAGGGLAVLAAGHGGAGEVAELLVHEMVHLLNRRALGWELPPWLEEGLAEDLAYSRIDAEGRLIAGTLGGREVPRQELGWLSPGRAGNRQRIDLTGARASLLNLLTHWDDERRLPLGVLVDVPWREFVEPANRALLYPESAFFIRFLLDGPEPALAAGFRGYLAAIAGGGSWAPAALARALGRELPALEKPYHDWLVARGWQELPGLAPPGS